MITNYLKSNKFELFILKGLQKRFNSAEIRKLKKEIPKLLGTRDLILAKTFYEIIKLVKLDIDEVCLALFPNQPSTNLDLLPESENKIRNFLTTYLGDLKLVSKASGIEYDRLRKLFNGEYINAYPEDIYGLSIAFNLKANLLFNYLYGDGERPIVGLVPDREVKSESEGKEK